MGKIVVVSVVRDWQMYEKCIGANAFIAEVEKRSIDNRGANDGIGVCYNRFLDAYDYAIPTWFVFCHEDFEIKEPLSPLLNGLDRNVLWGPIGAATRIRFGVYHQWQMLGQVEQSEKNGARLFLQGRAVSQGAPVETFDCQCLIVHSSLIQQTQLRFDEKLTFDLYVEDFCIAAAKRGIPSRILPVKAHHWSGGRILARYAVQEAYLNAKYSDACFTGTSSWILGGRPPFFRRLTVGGKRVLQFIAGKTNKFSCALRNAIFDAMVNIRNRHYRNEAIDDLTAMKIKIFVLVHRSGNLPECFADKRMYVPLQVGRAENPLIEGIAGDDTGDNISHLNPQFNEMTGMYWVCKHYSEIGAPEFVGFNHYRRFLEWDVRCLTATTHVVFASSYLLPRTVLGHFLASLGNVEDAFRVFLMRFSRDERFEQYSDVDRYCRQHLTYCCNLMITHKNTFFRYFSFIEKCIDLSREIMSDGLVDVSGPRFEDKRKFSYILEFMTGYWIWHEERKGTIKVRRACKRFFQDN